MIAFLTVAVLASSCHGISIGTVSDKNVTKRNAEAGDIFPDWVPFKNKQGQALGEFIQVEKKAKPKKRLALPVNFLLKAVAEPEGDDYYEKGQGESDDYFEKKEWSDLNRNAQVADSKNSVNHTDISEIDGVVSILTKKSNDPVLEAINSPSDNKARNVKQTEEAQDSNQETNEENTLEESKQVEVKKENKKPQSYEDDVEYEETSVEKSKADPEPENDEQSENEAKKASILDSVDELKERHAKEQRFISEKVKEEEIFKEQHERESLDTPSDDKYDHKTRGKKLSEYEEYDERDASQEDKYKISPLRIRTTIQPPSTITTTLETSRTKKRKGKKEPSKQEVAGKLSVFKNPQLYVVYDDDDTTSTTIKPTKSRPILSRGRFSSRFTMTTPSVLNSDENVRLSFVPQDSASKEGEPTLFFPKKRKNKRKKVKTTPATDSYVAETIADKTAKGAALDTTASGSIVSDTTAITSPSGSDTTAAGTLSSSSVTDAIPASSDHKKEPPKIGNYDLKRGVGRDFHSDNIEEHEEHGKKAYEGIHDDSKTAKGHHDKEDHLDKYDDHGSVEKEHLDESNHYGGHHHEEHGKKHAKYEESGKHSKGHSTKGSHDIHKKEEYEKKVEFFEEEGDSDEEEKHGGHNQEHGHSEGSKFEKGGLNAGHSGHHKGDSGHFAKGGHVHVHKGHKAAAGHDGHGQHGEAHRHREGKESGKKWVFHHGRPAKTANLVVIDRRNDGYAHGPHYYG